MFMCISNRCDLCIKKLNESMSIPNNASPDSACVRSGVLLFGVSWPFVKSTVSEIFLNRNVVNVESNYVCVCVCVCECLCVCGFKIIWYYLYEFK